MRSLTAAGLVSQSARRGFSPDICSVGRAPGLCRRPCSPQGPGGRVCWPFARWWGLQMLISPRPLVWPGQGQSHGERGWEHIPSPSLIMGPAHRGLAPCSGWRRGARRSLSRMGGCDTSDECAGSAELGGGLWWRGCPSLGAASSPGRARAAPGGSAEPPPFPIPIQRVAPCKFLCQLVDFH